MTTVRWGILGCGDVTEVKSGPAFQKCAGSDLFAVMRRDAAKAEDYARRHNVPRWYADADVLIADPEVDAIYIATPPALHEPYAIRCAAAGKPCYVEKPMARNGFEARRMVAAFAGRKVPLYVAYYRRGMARFQQARALLTAGRIGDLRRIDYHYADGQMLRVGRPVPWRLDPVQSGGGLFLDLGSHALDLMDWLAGPLRLKRSSATGRGTVEEQVAITFTAGAAVEGEASWDFTHSGPRIDEFTLTGTVGELRFSCFDHSPLRITANGSTLQIEVPAPAHVQQGLIQSIVNDLRGEPSLDIGDAHAGLRTQEFMDAALEPFYGPRDDNFWLRPPPRPAHGR